MKALRLQSYYVSKNIGRNLSARLPRLAWRTTAILVFSALSAVWGQSPGPVTLTPATAKILGYTDLHDGFKITATPGAGSVSFTLDDGMGSAGSGSVSITPPGTFTATVTSSQIRFSGSLSFSGKGSYTGDPFLHPYFNATDLYSNSNDDSCLNSPLGGFSGSGSFPCQVYSLGVETVNGQQMAYFDGIIFAFEEDVGREIDVRMYFSMGQCTSCYTFGIDHVEATQVVQDANGPPPRVGSIPLILGKETTLRIYPIGGPDQEMTVTLTSHAPGSSSGPSFTEATTLFVHPVPNPDDRRTSLDLLLPLIAVNAAGPYPVRVQVQTDDGHSADTTINLSFTRPAAWSQPLVKMYYWDICTTDPPKTCGSSAQISNYFLNTMLPVSLGAWPTRVGYLSFKSSNGPSVKRKLNFLYLTYLLLDFFTGSNNTPSVLFGILPADNVIPKASFEPSPGSPVFAFQTSGTDLDTSTVAGLIAETRGVAVSGARTTSTGWDWKLHRPIPAGATSLGEPFALGNGWISDTQYLGLINTAVPEAPVSGPKANAAAPAATAIASYMVITGTALSDGSAGTLDNGVAMPAGGTTGTPIPSNSAGNYCLHFSGAGGALSDYCFAVSFDLSTGSPATGSFGVLAPVPAGTNRVGLRIHGGANDGKEVASITAAPTPPALQITSPHTGDQLSAGTLNLTWSATTTSGNALTYTVLYSSDGGTTWTPVDAGLTDSQYSLDTTSIRGGTKVIFEVMASDGLNTTTAKVGPLTITQKPQIQVSPASLSMGSVSGSASVQTLTITNVGTGPLNVTGISSDNSQISALLTGSPAVVSPGDPLYVDVTYAPNSSGAPISGHLTIASNDPATPSVVIPVNGSSFTSVTLTPAAASVAATAGGGSVSVAVTPSSGWNAVSTVSWLSVNSPGSGTGNGMVGYAYTANGTAGARAGVITIAGQPFTVTQAAGTTHFSVSAPSGAKPGVSFQVTVAALDANNSAVASYSGVLHFTSSDAAAVLPADTVVTAGSNSFNVTLNTVGNATVTVSDAANLAASGTSAGIAVSSGGGGIPVTVSASPSSGTQGTAAYTFVFSDTAGYQSINVANVLINDFIDGRVACYIAIVPSSSAVYLVDDQGDAGGPYQGMTLPGSSVIQNSQCSIAGSGSSISGSGTTLTVTLVITFKTAFAGNRILYMAAREAAGANSGWQAMGTAGVAGGTLTGPTVTGISPAHTSSLSATYTVTLGDTNGFTDLGVINVLINDFLNGNRACYLAYARSSGVLYLLNDTGTALGNGMALGGSGSLSNSQCTVSSAGSSANGTGNAFTLMLNISFTPSFAGNRIIYVAARSNGDVLNSGWQAVGTVAVPSGSAVVRTARRQ